MDKYGHTKRFCNASDSGLTGVLGHQVKHLQSIVQKMRPNLGAKISCLGILNRKLLIAMIPGNPVIRRNPAVKMSVQSAKLIFSIQIYFLHNSGGYAFRNILSYTSETNDQI